MAKEIDRRQFLQGVAATAGAAAWPGGFPMIQQSVPKPIPRIANFERMAFGMFVHWGLYAQVGKGEWALNNHRIPHDEYRALMKEFTASEFSGRKLAQTAKRAGMRYVTLTSRHHDGFSLYDTRGLNTYDAPHSAAGRDLILDFVNGCREEGIVPMLYHTTLDWVEPRFNNDFEGYLQYLRDSVEILCTEYGEVGGFWFDGNWSKRDADWEEDELYAIIRKHQPEAMIINNTGIEAQGGAGNPEIDSVTFERGRPEPIDRTGHKKYVSGEMCHTFNFHWGIASNDFNYLSPAHVIEELCSARGAGANLLMNIGPTASGAVPEYEGCALARVGEWVAAHGDLIYDGKPIGDGQERDFVLSHGGKKYAFVFDLTPTSNTYAHGAPKVRGAGERVFTGLGDVSSAKWLDTGQELKVEQSDDETTLHTTGYPYGTNMVVRVAELA